MAGNGGVNGNMPQYGGGGFGQKAGDGRKGAVGDDVVDCEGIIGCRADLAGLERRSFLDRSTNNNTPKNGILLRVRLIGNR